MTRTVTLICWRLPYCVNVVDFIREMTSSSLRQCSVTPRKSDKTKFLRQNTSDFIAADEWASYSPDLNPLRELLHFWYPAAFRVRRPTTSLCKSTGPQRGNQKRLERRHHWDSWKIHWTIGHRRVPIRKWHTGKSRILKVVITRNGWLRQMDRCKA